jgi:hypothetical protein
MPERAIHIPGIATRCRPAASSSAMTATALGVHQIAPARTGAWARNVFATATRPDLPSPLERILELQRTAGNRAVAGLVAQRDRKPLPVPDPLDFGASPKPFEGAVSSDPYDRQPEALRVVIDESGRTMRLPTSVYPTTEAEKHKGALWWSRLDRQQQQAVVAIYNRMQTLGLWGHVHRITRVAHGECPVLKALHVSGDTPSVVFGGNASGMIGSLTGSSRMCYDAGVGGSLHAGQMSNREISDADSLHVSVGANPSLGRGEGDFDAHIDKYASPKGKRGLACEYDPVRTMAHQGREVVPSILHKGPRLGPIRVPPIGGFELMPEDTSQATVRPEMFENIERDEDKPPLAAGVTYRFNVGGGRATRRAEALKKAEEEGAAGRP